jgi:mono/diheme cytochrome c family protein
LPFVISLALVAVVSGTLGATASPSQEFATSVTNLGQRTYMTVDFTTALPEGLNQQMVEEGRNIFHDRGGCVRCHGKDGGGTFFGPALTNRRHLHLQTGSYQEILDLIRSGVPRPNRYLGAMPPLGGAQLSSDEVRAVGAFVYTLIHGS